MALIPLLLAAVAAAQDYSFPTSSEDYGNFYVTAYYDHSGVDWACGDYQYSGHRGSDYGVGSWSGMDAGQDLVAAADGSVVATNDGEYDRCDTGDCDGGGGYGNYVKIQHADGKYTYYAHMKQWSVAVSTGDWVACGTHLGQVGSSGYSTGPHIHFEVRESSGSQSDPFDGDCSDPPSYWINQGSYMGVPGRACESAGPCEPCGALSCGAALDVRNDGGGSTDDHAYYGCTKWSYTGPEVAWTFSTPRDEAVSIALTGLSADLDVYVLGSTACDGSDCLASSSNPEAGDESLTFDAAAGREVLVVVDGWEDATSSFHLEVDCAGGGDDSPPPDTDHPADSRTDSAGPSDSAARGPWPPGARTPWEEGTGCGCATPPAPGRALVPFAAAGLLLATRRRPGGVLRAALLCTLVALATACAPRAAYRRALRDLEEARARTALQQAEIARLRTQVAALQARADVAPAGPPAVQPSGITALDLQVPALLALPYPQQQEALAAVNRAVGPCEPCVAEGLTVAACAQRHRECANLPGLLERTARLAARGQSADALVEALRYEPPWQSVSLGDAPGRGPADAPVVVVAFMEAQCPFCQRAASTLQALGVRYGEDVRIVYKHMPLAMHDQARPAALALEAARRQGRFWEYHDALYARASELRSNDALLDEIATDVRLDPARFRHDRQDPAAEARVAADEAQAAVLGIHGTPHFFVNGYPVRGAQPLERFVALIDRELGRDPQPPR